jgi:hypothetical protein
MRAISETLIMHPTRIPRSPQVFGPNGIIPVGHTKFHEDYRYREGGEKFIPGTKIPRLRHVKLGERAVGFYEDEVVAVAEALRRHRDSTLAA